MDRRQIDRQQELSHFFNKQKELKSQALKEAVDVNKVVHNTRVTFNKLDSEEHRRFGQWRAGQDMQIENHYRAERQAF